MAVFDNGGCERGHITVEVNIISLGTYLSNLALCNTFTFPPAMCTSSVPLIFPFVLQWNTNGLLRAYRDLIESLLDRIWMSLRFRRRIFCHQKKKISKYFLYCSTTPFPSGHPKASLYVSVDVDMRSVDLSDLCSSEDEYIAATVSITGCRTAIVSADVRPNVHWDSQNISGIRTRCRGRIVIWSSLMRITTCAVDLRTRLVDGNWLTSAQIAISLF